MFKRPHHCGLGNWLPEDGVELKQIRSPPRTAVDFTCYFCITSSKAPPSNPTMRNNAGGECLQRAQHCNWTGY